MQKPPPSSRYMRCLAYPPGSPTRHSSGNHPGVPRRRTRRSLTSWTFLSSGISGEVVPLRSRIRSRSGAVALTGRDGGNIVALLSDFGTGPSPPEIVVHHHNTQVEEQDDPDEAGVGPEHRLETLPGGTESISHPGDQENPGQVAEIRVDERGSPRHSSHPGRVEEEAAQDRKKPIDQEEAVSEAVEIAFQGRQRPASQPRAPDEKIGAPKLSSQSVRQLGSQEASHHRRPEDQHKRKIASRSQEETEEHERVAGVGREKVLNRPGDQHQAHAEKGVLRRPKSD